MRATAYLGGSHQEIGPIAGPASYRAPKAPDAQGRVLVKRYPVGSPEWAAEAMQESAKLDEAYAGAAAFDEQTQKAWIAKDFEQFTRMTEAGIMHVRDGESRHAPILNVEKARIAEAQAILDRVIEYNGKQTNVDSIPPTTRCSSALMAHDYLGGEDEGEDPARDGWVDKNTGRP